MAESRRKHVTPPSKYVETVTLRKQDYLKLLRALASPADHYGLKVIEPGEAPTLAAQFVSVPPRIETFDYTLPQVLAQGGYDETDMAQLRFKQALANVAKQSVAAHHAKFKAKLVGELDLGL